MICLQMLLQTCSNENLNGTGLPSSKSVHILSGKLPPAISISSGSQHPKPICLAVLIIGSSSGLILTNLQQTVSQAIGLIPPITQPSGLALPRIGPGPSIAMTASIMVKAGFRNSNISMRNSQKSPALPPFLKCQMAFRLPATQPNIFLTANVATNC
ncbi:hypothetical protein ES703_44713 [subsurface metagenome]